MKTNQRGVPSEWAPLHVAAFRAIWFASLAANIGLWPGCCIRRNRLAAHSTQDTHYGSASDHLYYRTGSSDDRAWVPA